MSMMEAFRKFVGFRVLEYFLLNPSQEVHLKELARRIGVSSGSVKRYCDLFEEEGILTSERKGNLRIFRLNNSDFSVREMKKAYYTLLLKENGIENLCQDCTLAIYGSFASGELDEKSDLDIIVVGKEEDIDRDLLLELERRMNRRIQLTVVPPHKWERMKREGDDFVESVVRKHIPIKGTPL